GEAYGQLRHILGAGLWDSVRPGCRAANAPNPARQMTLWHSEVISESVATTLDELSRLELVSEFYLAGGTGLALHFGHRRSADLDLLTAGSTHEQPWLQALSSRLPEFSPVENA